jgi:outer membrane protein assembly factor BamA
LLLLPVRAAIQVGTYPVKAVSGVLSSSGLFDRLARAHERGVYLIPVPGVDPSLGLNLGLRAGHGSPVDPHGIITYRAAYGGTREQLYSLTVRSRDAELLPYRDGWSYKLMAKYEILPRKHYFGIGNLSDRADVSYYTLEQYLYLGTLRYAPSRWMACDLTFAVHRNQLRPGSYLEAGEKSLERGFPLEPLAPGFWIDPQNMQGEIALNLDRRDARGQPHAGWAAEGFVGYALGTGPDEVDFVRYGLDAQGYLPVARSHTLALRVAGEEARTSDEQNSIKLTELPSLGGRSTLRGYLADRFLDNASVLGSAEYRYRLSPLITFSAFADFGKVMPRLLDVDFNDLHRAFGAGLDFARSDQFYFRVIGARSDEDWIFTATLEPAFDRQDRRERR